MTHVPAVIEIDEDQVYCGKVMLTDSYWSMEKGEWVNTDRVPETYEGVVVCKMGQGLYLIEQKVSHASFLAQVEPAVDEAELAKFNTNITFYINDQRDQGQALERGKPESNGYAVINGLGV